MKHMIIDIGSNSVKYEAFQIINGDFIKIDHKAQVMGFLSYLEDRVLSEKGFSVLCRILADYKESAVKLGCERISSFATASFRSCREPLRLIEKIEKELGIKVVLFSGETEGYMSFLGMLHSHPEACNGVMFDMGGGSTEVNVFENKKSIFLKSLPFGALSMKNTYANHRYEDCGTEAFATKEELENIYTHAMKMAESFELPKNAGTHAFMVGGSAQFIGALCSKPGKDGITRFTKERLCEIIEAYSSIDYEKSQYLIKTVPNRYLLVIPAAISFKAIFDYMGIENLTVSKGGIREGYMKYILESGEPTQV